MLYVTKENYKQYVDDGALLTMVFDRKENTNCHD